MSEPTCSTCRFWKRDEKSKNNHGSCLRYPPSNSFPVLEGTAWCGEHQADAVEHRPMKILQGSGHTYVYASQIASIWIPDSDRTRFAKSPRATYAHVELTNGAKSEVTYAAWQLIRTELGIPE